MVLAKLMWKLFSTNEGELRVGWVLDDGLVNGHLNELRNIFVSTKSQDFKLLKIPRISVSPENGEGLLNWTVIGNQTQLHSVWQTDATFGCGSDLTSNGRGNLLEIFSLTLVCETVTAGSCNGGGSVDTSDRLWSLLGQKRHFLDGILGRILEREEATFLQSSSWHLRIFTTLWAEKIWFNVKVWIAITIQLTGYQKLKFCKMAVDPPVSHGDDDDPDRVDEEAPLLLIPTSQQPAPCRLLENPCLPCATIIFVIAATVLAYQIKIILLDPWSVRINHMPHKIGIPDSNWNGIVWTKHVSHLWVAQVYLGLEIRYSDRTGVRHCSQPEGGTGDPCGAMGGAWGCSQGSVDPGVRWSTAVEKLEQDPAHWNLSWLYPHGERLGTHHNWNFIRLYCCWND